MAVDEIKTLWVADVRRGQWAWPEARRRILQTANIDGPNVRVFAERPAYGGKIQGIDLIKDLQDNWERIDIPFSQVDPVGDIVLALNPVAARAEAGRVVLIQGEWNKEFLDEICAIPYTKFNDQGAALALGFRKLAGQMLGKNSSDIPPKLYSPQWVEQQRRKEQYEQESIIRSGGYQIT
jgi:predicted phage terminase large subunit-like protein